MLDERIPREADRVAPEDDPHGLLDRAARPESGIERLLVVDALRRGPRGVEALRAETAGLAPVRRALAADPRFALEEVDRFATAGYRLRVYRVVAVPATGSTR